MSRLKTLAENLVEEKEKEEKKDFKEILADILNAEEEAQLAATEEEEGEEGEEEADPEDENYPGRESAPRGEKQVDGVGEDLDSEELIKEYADLGEDEEDKAYQAAKEAAEKKKKLLAKAKAEKAEMDKKRKRLGVSSIKDAEEEAYDEIEEMNEAIEEETDYDEDSGPLPLTKDNILDTIGAIDPRLGVAVAGIRGVEDAINHPGSTADKMAAFGKTLGFGAINSVLGMVGLEMTPEQWQTATDKIAYGFEKVFAPGAASAKEAKWAQEEGQRAAAAQIQAATQRVQYKKFEVSAKANLDDARKFEALVDAVDGGSASDQQKADLAQITREWDEIDNGTAEQARGAYILYARRQKQTEANQTFMTGDYMVENVNSRNQNQTFTGNQQFVPKFSPTSLENQSNIRTTCAELGINTENFSALQAEKAKAEAMPSSGLMASIRAVRIDAINQQLGMIENGPDYFDYAKGRYEKYKCRPGNAPEPYQQMVYAPFQGMGVATPAPDGKGVYLAPFSNPFTGDFPWNAIYSEAEGIVPEFEAWFYFVVGQENTPAQKRTHLMRTLSIKTTPAFTAWMADWYERITIFPFPNPDRSWSANYTWVADIPPSYPILPFSQQYEAFTKAMTRWLAIVNDQARFCVDYQQTNVLSSAGLMPAQRYSSRNFQDVINERSDSPDTLIDPYQGGLTWRAIRGGLVFAPPTPPGLLNYLWTWYGIPQPTYTDPDTGLTISSFTDDGRAKTSQEINNEMNQMKANLKAEQDKAAAAAAEEQRKQEEIQARASKRMEFVKTREGEVAKREQAIQANASLKAQFELIQKINEEYKTAEGFAKRHWYDKDAAKAAGETWFYTKKNWEDEEMPSYYKVGGNQWQNAITSMLYWWYGSHDHSKIRPYFSAQWQQAQWESFQNIPETDEAITNWLRNYYKANYDLQLQNGDMTQTEYDRFMAQAPVNGFRRLSDGKQDKGKVNEEFFTGYPFDGEPLKAWQASRTQDFGGKAFTYTEPPTEEQLIADGFGKSFEDMYNNRWVQYDKGTKKAQQGWKQGDNPTTWIRQGMETPYTLREVLWKDVPDADKSSTYGKLYMDVKTPDDTMMVVLSPGAATAKMEDTEEYKRLIEVWNACFHRNLLVRRFKPAEWGADKDAKINDMRFLESDMTLMEGDDQPIAPSQVGYCIPLMTFIQWRDYLKQPEVKLPGGGSGGVGTKDFRDINQYYKYVLMGNFEADTGYEYMVGSGNIDINYDEEKKRQSTQFDIYDYKGRQSILAGDRELFYRIALIQYPDAFNIIVNSEAPKTGSGVGGCKECKAHPALMDYTCFSKGKGQPSRPKKKMSAEHLAKLQEGRKKYQAQKQREKRLY